MHNVYETWASKSETLTVVCVNITVVWDATPFRREMLPSSLGWNEA